MTKLSQITSGSNLNPATDQLLGVRGGSSDVLITPGTAAAKAASNGALANVASVSGTTTVGHLASFADTAGTIVDTPLGVNLSALSGTLIETLEFANYANITNYADATAALQNFIVTAYLLAVSRGALNLSDQGNRVRVKAKCMASTPVTVKCPIINLPFVDFDFPVELSRTYDSGGTVSSFYNGDTTSKALVNLYQPTFINPPLAHVSEIDIYCNPDGVHYGAGFYAGRAWIMQGNPTIGAAGSGYTNGDTVTVTNPHKTPYASATFTLTVSGSVVTAATLVSGGVWPAPPKILRSMWTDSRWLATQSAVFDGSSNWITTGGTGTGLTLNIPDTTSGWVPDFAGGTYNSTHDFSNYQMDTVLGRIKVQNCGTTTDATYGPMRAVFLTSLFYWIDSIESNGGYQGNVVYATDVLANKIYNVGALTQFKKFAGGNMHCHQIVCDTPAAGGSYYDLDHYNNSDLSLWLFNNGASNLSGISYSGRIGANSSAGSGVYAGKLRIFGNNAGTSAGVPLAFIDYAGGMEIELHSSNISPSGGSVAYPNSALATFGTHNGTGNTITGSCDGITKAAMFTNSVPAGFNYLISNTSEGALLTNALEIPTGAVFTGAPSVINPQAGRYYTSHCFSGLGTASQLTNSGNAVASLIPFYLSAAATPVNMACEVTTGSTTGAFNVDMGIYADNNGVPGTLLLDIGTTATGVKSVAQAATGVQIQAIPAGSLPGGKSVLQPGWYWLAMISTIPTTAGSLAFKAAQNNTTFTRGMIGESLTQGSASPTVVSGSYVNNTSANTAVLPATVTSLGSAGSSPPAVWIGF